MASESSFDIVNKVDHQEVDNAVNQAAKEISQRFDFKNVDAGIKLSGETIDMQANTEERVNAVLGRPIDPTDGGRPTGQGGGDVRLIPCDHCCFCSEKPL